MKEKEKIIIRNLKKGGIQEKKQKVVRRKLNKE